MCGELTHSSRILFALLYRGIKMFVLLCAQLFSRSWLALVSFGCQWPPKTQHRDLSCSCRARKAWTKRRFAEFKPLDGKQCDTTWQPLTELKDFSSRPQNHMKYTGSFGSWHAWKWSGGAVLFVTSSVCEGSCLVSICSCERPPSKETHMAHLADLKLVV